MLKRQITYETFEGETVTEEFYFNLSKSEIVEMEVEYEGGLQAMLEKIIATEDRKGLVAEFKKIVLYSYGVKSEDGKRFIKSEQLREEFTQTPAYDVLFMELATDETKAAEFMNGVIPRDLAREMESTPSAPSQMAPPPPSPTGLEPTTPPTL